MLLGAAGALVAGSVSVSAASSKGSIPVTPDSQLNAFSTTMGGAPVESTTDTIPHWAGSSLNPVDGVTYGYNMVGSNPFSCAGAACSTDVQVDITPITVNVAGMSFSGSDSLNALLSSPVFQGNDYGSTPFATQAGNFPNPPAFTQGPGGVLSQGDAGNSLQLEDATMRAQFNQTGSSPYHLTLTPHVMPALTINVPNGNGVLTQSGRGVVFAKVQAEWWGSRIQNLMQSSDTHHLPLFWTSNVLLYIGSNLANCCIIGFHGAGEVNGHGTGSVNGNANQHVQTFAWASWLQPGIYSRGIDPNTGLVGSNWALQDIHPVSHELAEWADDPFVNNKVQPWLTPTAPQYGCTGVLETGDPVVGIGFAVGTNTYQQGPNPNGSQSADGYYHPEDEAYLPWFMRTAPNTVSEPTQSPSPNIGRYTLMGDLNPFAGFRQPATGC
ncbi:MAG TPA: hypothetical protein VFB69_02990 [Candidatus Dormibacteraeota bacterium]|nr:hypothetical protein [Candidatus Dormibacteraeota bacterium]